MRCVMQVLDKDGVSAAMRVAEMGTLLARQNKTLSDQLQEIYKTWVSFRSKELWHILIDHISGLTKHLPHLPKHTHTHTFILHSA